MSTENKNMPRLRFPGFTGEWVEKKLGEVATFRRGVTITAKDTKKGDVPVIAGGQTPSYFHNVSNREGETIAISASGAYAGFVSFWNIPVFLSDSFSVETKNELFKKFTFYYLKHQQNKLFLMQKGAGVPHVHGLDVGNLLIPYPSLVEQQKIAECLTAIDDLIVAQGKKVDALKEHKKGLMQQLFPQPGETTPRFRFPGFTGEWVEKKINEIFDFRQGFQCPIDLQSMHQKEGYVRFIRIIDLTQTTEPPRYIENPGLGYYVNKDDLFMVRYGSPGLVGYGYEGVIANNLFKLLPKVDMCTKLYKYILTYLYADIVALCPINVLPAINFTSLGCLRISFPPSLAEQQKIAECLSELDALIADEAKQLDALKEHKKGLMQQLFPQPTT